MNSPRKVLVLVALCALAFTLPTLLFYSVAHFNLTDMEPVSVIRPQFDKLAPSLPVISAAISACVSALSLAAGIDALRTGKHFARTSTSVAIALLLWNSIYALGEPALYFLAIYTSTEAYEHHYQLGRMLQLVWPITSAFSLVVALISATLAVVISFLMFGKKNSALSKFVPVDLF